MCGTFSDSLYRISESDYERKLKGLAPKGRSREGLGLAQKKINWSSHMKRWHRPAHVMPRQSSSSR
jgi:hypothetical protein